MKNAFLSLLAIALVLGVWVVMHWVGDKEGGDTTGNPPADLEGAFAEEPAPLTASLESSGLDVPDLSVKGVEGGERSSVPPPKLLWPESEVEIPEWAEWEAEYAGFGIEELRKEYLRLDKEYLDVVLPDLAQQWRDAAAAGYILREEAVAAGLVDQSAKETAQMKLHWLNETTRIRILAKHGLTETGLSPETDD